MGGFQKELLRAKGHEPISSFLPSQKGRVGTTQESRAVWMEGDKHKCHLGRPDKLSPTLTPGTGNLGPDPEDSDSQQRALVCQVGGKSLGMR